MTQPRMKEDERCLDCEDVIADSAFEGMGGDPIAPYELGLHICGKKTPRVVNTPKEKIK